MMKKVPPCLCVQGKYLSSFGRDQKNFARNFQLVVLKKKPLFFEMIIPSIKLWERGVCIIIIIGQQREPGILFSVVSLYLVVNFLGKTQHVKLELNQVLTFLLQVNGLNSTSKIFSPIVTATCSGGVMTVKVETLENFIGVVQSRDFRKPECSGYGEDSRVTLLRINMWAETSDPDYCGVFVNQVSGGSVEDTQLHD